MVRLISEKGFKIGSKRGYKWGKYASSTQNFGCHLPIPGFDANPDMLENGNLSLTSTCIDFYS